MHILSVVALSAIVTGCAASPRYAYRPTAQSAREDAPGDLDGVAAAGYSVARGDVHIAAVGIATARLRNRRAARALEVRIVVHNASRDVWIVESNDQRATLDDAQQELEPVMARCDGDVMPEAVLMPNDTRTIDLYYELPPPLADARTVPSVRVAWRVATPSGVVAHKITAFERFEHPPEPEPPVDLHALRRQLAASRPEWRGWRN
jgi:hypothetical protein